MRENVKFKCPYCGVEQYHFLDTDTIRHVLLCDRDHEPGCDRWFVGGIRVEIKGGAFEIVDPGFNNE